MTSPVWGCMCKMENTNSHSWDLLTLVKQGWSHALERDGSWRLCQTPDGVEITIFLYAAWIFESDLFSEMPRPQSDKYFSIFPSKFDRHSRTCYAVVASRRQILAKVKPVALRDSRIKRFRKFYLLNAQPWRMYSKISFISSCSVHA